MLFSSLLLLSAYAYAIASPALSTTSIQRAVHNQQSIEIIRHRALDRTPEEWAQWAQNHREALMSKYGASHKAKRGTSGTNLLTNQNADSSFYGSIAIGTPPVAYNVILDTGSADLWVADSSCQADCQNVPEFQPSSSSSFQNLSTEFSVTYGSGNAAGTLGRDTIQMAGFSVQDQTFATCDEVSKGVLTSPVSGIMGLGFQGIASSHAMPFWQTLATGGAWNEPLMAFQLTRFLNDSNSKVSEPGGTFTMGALNTSLYTGDIDYQNIPSDATGGYWILPMTSLTVQGNSINLASGSDSYAAIDTGTTLVGGPPQSIADIYKQIPNSGPADSSGWPGYYSYPCDTTVSVSMAFGGKTWSISPSDFRLTQLDQNSCIGAFFTMQTSSSAPAWIVGDTFLKNVYSVFRATPPSIGFAQLSDASIAQNGVNGDAPSPTIGSVIASATARNSGPRQFSAIGGAFTTTFGAVFISLAIIIL